MTDFVEQQFVPIVRETWATQIRDWGFGNLIHPDWDDDGLLDIIVTAPPYALFDGIGTYTVFSDAEGRPYPQRRIWWRSSIENFLAYDKLENGYKAVFAHEFFHLAQWNVLLLSGRPNGFWQNVFIEAQGKFAPGVQYPELELHSTPLLVDDNAYASSANRFLAERLNTSYAELEAERRHRYDLVLYWRFLYEQYHGMGIVRAALEEMARQHTLAGHTSGDVVGAMKDTMDAAFARVDGPFHNHEESLNAFARANYALRLENGRCDAADLARCEGFYFDPEQMYTVPPLEAQIAYEGTRVIYSGALPASYGMDFVEVNLNPGVNDQALTITLRGEGAGTRFSVQVWSIVPAVGRPRAVTLAPQNASLNADGAVSTVIPVEDLAHGWLALIITRLDANEIADPVGGYQVTLESVALAAEQADPADL